MSGSKKSAISRRDFARRTALAASAACLPSLLPESAQAAAAPAPREEAAVLTSASQAEVNATVAAIIHKYGARMTDAQKLDVRRIVTDGQKSLEAMRSFPFNNSDQPANVLKIYPDLTALAAAHHASAEKK